MANLTGGLFVWTPGAPYPLPAFMRIGVKGRKLPRDRLA